MYWKGGGKSIEGGWKEVVWVSGFDGVGSGVMVVRKIRGGGWCSGTGAVCLGARRRQVEVENRRSSFFNAIDE